MERQDFTHEQALQHLMCRAREAGTTPKQVRAELIAGTRAHLD
jgi:hypothetical protein